MNRRHFLVALAVIAPVAVFIPTKIAASWRPVKVAPLLGTQPLWSPWLMRVSQRYVVTGGGIYTRFDLQTGQRQLIQRESIAENGAWTAKLRPGTTGSLELLLSKDGATFAYPIANANFSSSDTGLEAKLLSRQTLRVSPNSNRVELIFADTYNRWNLTSRRLERSISAQIVPRT